MSTNLPEVYASDLLEKGTPESGYVFLGETQTPVKVDYMAYNNLAILDGDIIVAPSAKMKLLKAHVDEAMTKGKAMDIHVDVIIDMKRLWPKGKVYFAFDPNVTAQTKTDIQKAILAISNSCKGITFTARTNEPNYVSFVMGLGHSSYVGMIGGKQEITLGKGYVVGNIIHEIGHTLGLLHEHTKPNRDQYITVNMSNIITRAQNNFTIINHPELFKSFDYDLGSIMHYSKGAFAENPQQDTITPKVAPKPGVVMGQRVALSPLDIEGINALYTGISVMQD